MKLSIVIPALNEEAGIEKALKQISGNLTEIDHEIIVSDDGSTDRTVEIAKRYAKVVFDKSAHKTIATNRNNGGRSAKGEFIVFIDADMFIPEPNSFFKILLAKFSKDPKLVGVTVNIMVYPDEATWQDNFFLGISNLTTRLMNNVFRIGAASGEFQMVRRTAFESIGGYREHLVVAEDQDLFQRLAKIGSTRFEPRLTAYNDGRRPHTVGWIRLFWGWMLNYFSVALFNRSYNVKWSEVRFWKLSFVIPAYNEEHYLGDCLAAIMKQKENLSYEVEVIVVNNASTDRTAEVARSFKGVKVIDEPKKGIVHARRAGFMAASGDLIANVDADTRLTPGWIKKVMQAFAREDSLVALSGPFVYFDAPSRIQLLTKWFYYLGYFFYILNRFVFRVGSMLQGGNFVVRRNAVDAAGGYNTNLDFYGEDTDMARRLNKVGKVRFTFDLPMYSSGRRLAKEGGFTMGLRYSLNYFWITFFNKPFSKSYTDIRPGNGADNAMIAYAPQNSWKEWVIGTAALLAFLAIAGGLIYFTYYLAR